MSFQWQLVAGFLYFEIGLIFLFLLPMISPQKWQKLFNARAVQWITDKTSFYFYIVLLILSLFLFDSIKDMNKCSGNRSKPLEDSNYTHEMKNSIKLFRAQRNFYITFFSMFLFYVLRRVISSINREATLIERLGNVINDNKQINSLVCDIERNNKNHALLEEEKKKEIELLHDELKQLQLDYQNLDNERNLLEAEHLDIVQTVNFLKQRVAAGDHINNE